MKKILEQIYSILSHLALLQNDCMLDRKTVKLKEMIDEFSEDNLSESEKDLLEDNERSSKD